MPELRRTLSARPHVSYVRGRATSTHEPTNPSITNHTSDSTFARHSLRPRPSPPPPAMSALPPEKASSVAARPCLRPCLVLLVLPSAPFPRTKADDGSVLANARDRHSVNMALPRRCLPPDDNAIAVCMWGVEYSQRRCTVVKSKHLSGIRYVGGFHIMFRK